MPTISKVEKGIPIPDTDQRWPRYPWATMEVGDSFEVIGKVASLRSVISQRNRAHPKTKFIWRKLNAITLRVWRIE